MNKKDIAILAFKVLSFYAFIEAIGKLSDIIYFILNGIRDPSFVTNLLLISIPPILLVFCCILLWYLAPSLATNIFKSTMQEDKTEMTLSAVSIIAFSVVGLFLLADALPHVVSLILMLYTVVDGQTESKSILINNIIVVLLRFILGLWLLFDSRRIVNYVYRKRSGHNV